MPDTDLQPENQSSSTFVGHEACPVCGSSDALARYDDNHTFCFSCTTHMQGTVQEDTDAPEVGSGFIKHRPTDLRSRGIRASTCRLAGYGVAEYQGNTVQVADYRNDEGTLIAQKLKTADKKFTILGNGRHLSCWQMHRFKGGGRKITVFEGETDCLKWLDIFPRYPAVSVPNGAAGAEKAVARDIDFFESFEEVIVCFDADDAGRSAAVEVAQLFTPGKCKLMKIPEGANDVCDAWANDLQEQLVQAFWEAKPYRPDGIVAGDELLEAIMDDTMVPSAPYPWVGLNNLLHGMRTGELVTICSGTGVGKSQICRSLALHLMREGHKVGYIALEEGLAKTGLSLLGLALEKPLHLDRSVVTPDEMREAFDRDLRDKVFVYNSFGNMSAANLLSKCRYLRIAEKCSYLIIDHLSILVSSWSASGPGGVPDERRAIDNVMTALRSQVCEATGVGMILVSHLRRVEGRSAERGADPELSHLRGSQAISQLSDACIALSRDTMGEDPNLMTVRVIKNRFSGELGVACHLRWDPKTGTHTEVAPEFMPNEEDDVPF